MPQFVEIDLAHLAPVTFLAAGGRKERTTWVRCVATVAIPSLVEEEAPLVFRGRSREGMQVRSSFDGVVYGPVDDIDYNDRGWSDEATLRDRAADPSACGHLLFGTSPWKDAKHVGDVPADARILVDGRHGMAERVSLRGRGLALVGGRAFAAAAPPVVCVMDWGCGGARIVLRDRPGHGYSFDPHRMGAALEFVARNVGPGGYSSLARDVPEIEVNDPCMAGLDETVPNALAAIGNAMHAVKDRLPALAPCVIAQLAELARIRDGLGSGACVPGEADAALAALDALRPGIGRATHLLHAIRIGRDAIASSSSGNGAADGVAPQDMEALEGLAA